MAGDANRFKCRLMPRQAPIDSGSRSAYPMPDLCAVWSLSMIVATSAVGLAATSRHDPAMIVTFGRNNYGIGLQPAELRPRSSRNFGPAGNYRVSGDQPSFVRRQARPNPCERSRMRRRLTDCRRSGSTAHVGSPEAVSSFLLAIRPVSARGCVSRWLPSPIHKPPEPIGVRPNI